MSSRIKPRDRVLNAPLRERFERLHEQQGLTTTQVAVMAGWTYKDGRGDGTYVARLLGLRGWEAGGGRYSAPSEHMSYRAAVRLAEALGMDPHEAGV